MFEALVGGFLLTGMICVQEGDAERDCRDLPQVSIGSKYVCDQRRDFLLERVPGLDPAALGYGASVRLRVHASCSPQEKARI